MKVYDIGVWQRAETIPIHAEFYNVAGALEDPTTWKKITIKDPVGSVTDGADAQAMTQDNSTTGKWHYDFLSGATVLTGVWTGWVEAKSGTKVTKQPFQFTLEVV